MKNTIRTIFTGIITTTALMFFFGLTVYAETSGSHYPYGAEGVKAASVPPPGFHYRTYNTLYHPTTLRDNNGDKLDVNFDLNVFSSVQRFIHVTEYKILGGNFFYNVLVPLVYKDLEIDASGVSDSQGLGLGDIVFEFSGLGWHLDRLNFVAALAVIAPTGEFDENQPASLGLGYWSGMLTLGATAYFDEAKTWSFSALSRTLVHTEQKDTNITPGSEFVVEYGLGKEFAVREKLLVRPGIAGCSYWQISDDSDGNSNDNRKQSHAIGAEINFFWLPPTLFQVNLRVLRDYSVENGPDGAQVVVTLTKSW